ncbi:efflux RND transporter permease subunit [Geodermatophilus sp. YIM 151500]|uniref:efflux RND transporter permease subunit n=1 Tax=Geodermatophilus sp. YIM 151500 TaxID=2984531 RepID=UPI0021E4AC76|nr:efflux RND transporter permease subunit [Geodermatophilus sp. YIM 151500]MCV2487983.1 efflux RND transporter permease subunit [Geodermatophilus sp. YIM 151500]
MASSHRTLMGWTVATSLRFRHLVAALGALLMAVGIIVIPSSRLDVFPEFAPPRVIIQTVCLGLSTADVEELVTVPLEQAVNGVDGLDVLRSKSSPMLSSVELIFDRDVDLLTARQLVQERMTAATATLPTWAAPPVMLAPASATSRAVKIGMSSKDESLIQMSMTAYWTVRARLLQVPGVANVTLWGERLQMLQVQVRPEDMVRHDVTLNQVMETTAEAVDSGLLLFDEGSLIGPGGIMETPNQRMNVRNVLPIVTPADLAQVPIERAGPVAPAAAEGGGAAAAPEEGAEESAAEESAAEGEAAPEAAPPPVVRLDQVATVTEDHQPLMGDGAVNDDLGLMLIVEKLPWADTVELTRGVEEVVKDLEPSLPSIQFDSTLFQQENFIQTAIDNLSEALLLGFLLVVLILALFLYEWRVAVISLLTIPLSITATLLVLYMRDQTINTMTLAGLVIALGALVDDAIIDVENIVRRLRQHRLSGSGASTAKVILDASLEVRSPIVYATLIIVAASIPVFLLQGLTGAFFQPLALAYTLAILASLVVALTVTPALALIMLRNAPIERRQSPLVRRLQAGYTHLLARVVRRPKPVYAGTGLLLALAVAVVPTLGQSLLPHFKERDFLMHWVAQPGTSAAEMQRITLAASRELMAIPGIRNFSAHLGQAVQGDEPYGINFGENWISVDPHVDYDETVAAIDEVVADYPGLFRDRKTYLDERTKEVVAGGSEPIIVRLFGNDLHTLNEQAQSIEDILGEIDGITNEHLDLHSDIPQIDVEVDLAKAASYGVKPGDVRRAAATMVAGEEVGDIFRGGRAYDVVVWTEPQSRDSVQDVQDMLLDTPSGQRIRLSDVASVEVVAAPNSIEREDGSRHLDILADVEGRDIGSVGEEVAAALAAYDFPRGFHAELRGDYEEQQAATARLFTTGAISLAVIFLLLQVSLGSWRPALLSFITLPLALIGGVLVAFASGGVLSIGSIVGFFTVFGIAARNGILLINHAQHLEREEGETFGFDLVLRAARERLAPILMTSLATGLALVPLAVFGERPGQEIEHPLALVILGGLFTSTLLSLFVIPALYLRFGKSRREREAAAGGGTDAPPREPVPA